MPNSTYIRDCADPSAPAMIDHGDGRLEVVASAPNPTIERARKAVQDEFDRQNEGALCGEGGGIYDADEMARAVLRAIREPSEAMLEAGDEYINQHTGPIFEPDFYGDVSGVWQAMIDAALSDDERLLAAKLEGVEARTDTKFAQVMGELKALGVSVAGITTAKA